ncbi:hypothetical protein KKC91_11070 [bacterium]|nr:hypothetical protein [bacterium]
MAITVKEIKEDDISLGRHFAIWSGCDCRFMDYDGLGFSRDSIEDYVKKNPFPEDEYYSEGDMICDFTSADGSVTLRCEKEETADWVADMINALL